MTPEQIAELKERLHYVSTDAADAIDALDQLSARIKEQDAQIAMLREALAHYVNVVESVYDQNDFSPSVRDSGGPARTALAATAPVDQGEKK